MVDPSNQKLLRKMVVFSCFPSWRLSLYVFTTHNTWLKKSYTFTFYNNNLKNLYADFKFESEMYNVFQVSRTQHKDCDKNIPIPDKRYDHGPALVPLIYQGEFYFICNWFDYCNLGLHLMVNVNQSNTP